MNPNQVRQEIAIIKDMVEKSRKEAAESGTFFIGIGILGMIATPAIGLLESLRMDRMVLPVLVVMTVASALIGYFTVARTEKKERVKSYPKTLCYRVLFACSIPGLMVMFLFPFLKVYPWNAVPVLTSMLMGIMVYSAGTIYEISYIQWCSVSWWAGSVLMALFSKHPWIRISIMNLSLFAGFVIPGFILNRKYRGRKS
jgi:hypothetical protein